MGTLQPYKCQCGHVIPPHGKVMHDKFSELKVVRRTTPGNALCPKCKQPIPFDCCEVSYRSDADDIAKLINAIN